jgi:hypothetical protein
LILLVGSTLGIGRDRIFIVSEASHAIERVTIPKLQIGLAFDGSLGYLPSIDQVFGILFRRE